jgi:PhoH-like ATPase
MKKLYVLDTNVLLHNPEALFAFEDNEIVIPFSVIEEIDNQKRRQDEIGRNARMVSQILDGLRGSGRLSEGIRLETGGRVRIELNHQELIDFPKGLEPGKCDNRILAVACNLRREGGGPVILVTKDLNLRIKADVLSLPAEDFTNDKVDYSRLYTGVGEMHLTTEEMDRFYQDGRLALNGEHTLW